MVGQIQKCLKECKYDYRQVYCFLCKRKWLCCQLTFLVYYINVYISNFVWKLKFSLEKALKMNIENFYGPFRTNKNNKTVFAQLFFLYSNCSRHGMKPLDIRSLKRKKNTVQGQKLINKMNKFILLNRFQCINKDSSSFVRNISQGTRRLKDTIRED